MALKIRLARGGSKKRPFYRIVVAEATSPRDGRFVERVGSYNPILVSGHAERVVLNAERIQYWISVGAQPTDRVVKFLSSANLMAAPTTKINPKQATPKKKAQARSKAENEKLAALTQSAAIQNEPEVILEEPPVTLEEPIVSSEEPAEPLDESAKA
jgi:small subunit ribosomal protein S16